MMQVIHAPWQTNGGETPGITRGTLVRSALAVVILLTLCAWLASTYFGHAPGPYGACYASNGRSVPCEVVTRKH